MSSRWNRALEADQQLAVEYRAELGLVNKAAFRARWAQQERKRYESTKKKVTRNVKKEKLEGKYLSLSRIAHKEGGGADGRKNAVRYCTNCVIFGKHWVKWDRMTDTLKFYYVEHSISDEYSVAYEEFQTWSSTEQAAPPGACSASAAASSDGTGGSAGASGSDGAGGATGAGGSAGASGSDSAGGGTGGGGQGAAG
eukprot:9485748-Pyramimonas_sp.AAC.1